MNCDWNGESGIALDPLPHSLEEYEPVISKGNMQFLYTQTHSTYVSRLNALLKEAQKCLAGPDYNDKQIRILTEEIKYNGGGHLNHQFFWESIIPISHGGGL